jgi:hypothetical protein
MTILHRLPSINQDGGPLPEDLQGSTLLRIGMTEADVEGGEFVIEYVPKDQQTKRRLTLLFDGRGMWIESFEIFT